MKLPKSWRSKVGVAAILAAGLVSLVPGRADAQMGNYFYYRNPRTGQTYTVGGVYGNGFRTYQGGFSYSRQANTTRTTPAGVAGRAIGTTGAEANTARPTMATANSGAGEENRREAKGNGQ